MGSPLGILGVSRIAQLGDDGVIAYAPARRTLTFIGCQVADDSRLSRTLVSLGAGADLAQLRVSLGSAGFYGGGYFALAEPASFDAASEVLISASAAGVVLIDFGQPAVSAVHRKYLVNVGPEGIEIRQSESGAIVMRESSRMLWPGASARIVYDRDAARWYVSDGVPMSDVDSDHVTRFAVNVTVDGEPVDP